MFCLTTVSSAYVFPLTGVISSSSVVNGVFITALQVAALLVVLLLVSRVFLAIFQATLGSIVRGKQRYVSSFRRRLSMMLLSLSLLLALGLVGLNTYLIYQGRDVIDFQLELLSKLPRQFWMGLAIALSKCILLILTAALLQTSIRRSIRSLSNRAQNLDQIQGNDLSISEFFKSLGRAVSTGVWLGVAALCSVFLGLPAAVTGFISWLLATFLTISAGFLITKASPILIDTADGVALQRSESQGIFAFYTRFRDLLPLLRRCLELVVYLVTVSIILQYTDPVAWLSKYTYQLVGLVAVYFSSRFFIELTRVAVDQFANQTDGLTETQKQRRLTIAPLCKSFLKYVVYFGALITALNILELDTAPILAGAGVLGVTIGFGAQSLVEDVVSGFLLLFENYYLVGDYIRAGRLEERPVEGFVEAIELRTTQVRHPDGQLQIIRNGEVGSVVNYSKKYIYATVDIPLSYNVNLDEVYSVLESLGSELQQTYADIVIEPTQVEGIESLGKSLLLLRTITKVEPGKHLYIQRVLRKQLKEAFDQTGIELSDPEPEGGGEED